MPAQLAIDPSRFATAEAAMADPNLRFKPQAQYANVAEGGRIGYEGGGLTDYQIFKLKELGYGKAGSNPGSYGGVKILKDILKLHNYAQGGRIGYADGMTAAPRFSAEDKFRMDMRRNLIKKLGEQYPDATIDELYEMMKEQYGLERAAGIQGVAQGGRIGYATGGDYITKKPRDMDMNWGDADTGVYTAKERFFEKNPRAAKKFMQLDAEHEQDVAEYEGAALFDKAAILAEVGCWYYASATEK